MERNAGKGGWECYIPGNVGLNLYRLDLIKLLLLITSLILSGIMLFHFKKCRNNNLKIEVYLFTTIYFLIISNLLECLWVASRIISLSSDIEINPCPKSNALSWCFSICH